MLDVAGTVLDDQVVVLTVFDVELEYQVQASGGTGVELGLHGFDDVSNVGHGVFLFLGFFLAAIPAAVGRAQR
ncbi:hypothetical protein D3C79_994060 [compost metagenome]